MLYLMRYLNSVGFKVDFDNCTYDGSNNYVYIRGVRNRNKQLSNKELKILENNLRDYLKIKIIRVVGRYQMWEQSIEGKVNS